MADNLFSSFLGRDMAVDLGIEFTENLIHGSDSAQSSSREISLFFPDL